MSKQANKQQSIGDQLNKTPTAAFTEKAAAFAREIFDAATGVVKQRMTLEKKGKGLFGIIMRAGIAGVPFAEMEAAEPRLLSDKKISGTYEPIRAMVNVAREHGVSLVDEKGEAKTKAALGKDNLHAKAKKAGIDTADMSDKDIRAALKGEKAEKSDKTTGPNARPATPEEIVASAFAHLLSSAELREQFAARIMETAKALANDAAVKADNREKAEKAAQARKEQKAADAKAKAEALEKAKADNAAQYAAHGLNKSAEPQTAMQAALTAAGVTAEA